jgi:arylsulfatase A-like enzyme
MDQPFFMFVGFPNPHNPFEPPEPYASMYDPDEIPLPETFHSDLSGKPPHQLTYKREGRSNIGANYEELDASRLRRVIAHYYGSVSLVDAQVGKIVAALEECQLLDNTLVVFMSDHGELLGHHGMLLKSTDKYPMLFDKSLHVPLIFRLPGTRTGRVIQDSVELIDVAPTIMDDLGFQIPPEMQSYSLLPAMQGGTVTQREFVFAESGAVKMLRGERYKLVYYPGQSYGELYDLSNDPLEMNNLYENPSYQQIRATMIQSLLDRLIYTEAPLHGESKRGPAYWRSLYRLPFE